MNFKNILMMAFCLLSLVSFAQSEQVEIRLIDAENNAPIVSATFEFGSQSGLSDQNGTITFSFVKNTTLKLSHVAYGNWFLSEEELTLAIKEKLLFKAPLIQSLHPVTIIAVKPQPFYPDGEVKIKAQDRLEHDAAEILNQSPAFNSIRKGGNYGFDPVFRGFKYDQLNVVLNGAQSATAACPNRMDPPTSQMAPNLLNRIEILKGPHALRFGTGLGATINFIPAKLQFSQTPDLYGRLSSGYESNGNLFSVESQLGLRGKRYDISIFSSYSQGDDYTTGNNETVEADFSRASFGTILGFQINQGQQLRLSAIYNRARDADFPALPMDLRKDDTWMFNAKHDIQFDGEKLRSWNTTIFGSFVDHLMDNLIKPLNPRMLNAETLAKTYNFGGRTEGVWNFLNSKMHAGADLRVEGAEGTRIREFLRGPMAGNIFLDNAWQESRISKTGLFVEYQILGDHFDYIASGRLELNNAEVNDPTQEFTQANPKTQVTQLNPSVSIGILKSFGKKVHSGLWLARAQRSGSLTERFINYFPVGQDPFEMLGNPQLDPETNYQADWTIQLNLNQKTSIDVDVFGAYLVGYISSTIDPLLTPRLPRSPGVRRYINIDEAFKTGFEVRWNQHLFAGLSHNMGLAYTYGQDLERNEPLPEIAPLDIRYSLYGSYLNNRLKPEVLFRYVAQQSRVSTEFGETRTPSFTILDLKLGYEITPHLNINAGVNNLLDEHYYEHLNRSVRGANAPIFAPGRNIFANITFTF